MFFKRIYQILIEKEKEKKVEKCGIKIENKKFYLFIDEQKIQIWPVFDDEGYEKKILSKVKKMNKKEIETKKNEMENVNSLNKTIVKEIDIKKGANVEFYVEEENYKALDEYFNMIDSLKDEVICIENVKDFKSKVLNIINTNNDIKFELLDDTILKECIRSEENYSKFIRKMEEFCYDNMSGNNQCLEGIIECLRNGISEGNAEKTMTDLTFWLNKNAKENKKPSKLEEIESMTFCFLVNIMLYGYNKYNWQDVLKDNKRYARKTRQEIFKIAIEKCIENKTFPLLKHYKFIGLCDLIDIRQINRNGKAIFDFALYQSNYIDMEKYNKELIAFYNNIDNNIKKIMERMIDVEKKEHLFTAIKEYKEKICIVFDFSKSCAGTTKGIYEIIFNSDEVVFNDENKIKSVIKEYKVIGEDTALHEMGHLRLNFLANHLIDYLKNNNINYNIKKEDLYMFFAYWMKKTLINKINKKQNEVLDNNMNHMIEYGSYYAGKSPHEFFAEAMVVDDRVSEYPIIIKELFYKWFKNDFMELMNNYDKKGFVESILKDLGINDIKKELDVFKLKEDFIYKYLDKYSDKYENNSYVYTIFRFVMGYYDIKKDNFMYPLFKQKMSNSYDLREALSEVIAMIVTRELLRDVMNGLKGEENMNLYTSAYNKDESIIDENTINKSFNDKTINRIIKNDENIFRIREILKENDIFKKLNEDIDKEDFQVRIKNIIKKYKTLFIKYSDKINKNINEYDCNFDNLKSIYSIFYWNILEKNEMENKINISLKKDKAIHKKDVGIDFEKRTLLLNKKISSKKQK